MFVLAQSVPSQLSPDQVGSWIFCLVGVIAAVAGSLGVVVLWQKVTKPDPSEAVVTQEILDTKISESEQRITKELTDFEQRLTRQINKVETHEAKLEEYKHETRAMLLESNHKVELQLSKLSDVAKRWDEKDLSLYVKKDEFNLFTLEFKDHRAYTHAQVHDIRNFMQELRFKMEMLIAMGQGKSGADIKLTQSNPDFKLPPEAGGK